MLFDFTVLKSAVGSPLNDSLAQNPGDLCGTDAMNINSRKLVKKQSPTQANSLCTAWHTTHFHKDYSSKGSQISCILYSPVWVTEKREVKASRLHDTTTSWITWISFCRPFCFYASQNSSLIPITVIHQLSTKTTIQCPWTYPSAGK